MLYVEHPGALDILHALRCALRWQQSSCLIVGWTKTSSNQQALIYIRIVTWSWINATGMLASRYTKLTKLNALVVILLCGEGNFRQSKVAQVLLVITRQKSWDVSSARAHSTQELKDRTLKCQ